MRLCMCYMYEIPNYLTVGKNKENFPGILAAAKAVAKIAQTQYARCSEFPKTS